MIFFLKPTTSHQRHLLMRCWNYWVQKWGALNSSPSPTLNKLLLTFMCINNCISAFWMRRITLVHPQTRVFLPLWKLLALDWSAQELNQEQILRIKWQWKKEHKGELLGGRTNKQRTNKRRTNRQINQPTPPYAYCTYFPFFLWPVHELRCAKPLALGWMSNMTLVFSVCPSPYVYLWVTQNEPSAALGTWPSLQHQHRFWLSNC